MKHDGSLTLLSSGMRPFRSRVLRGLALVAALILAGLLVLMVAEAPLYPWARSFHLWPTLTGDWHGELHTPAGRTVVYFEIRGGGRAGRHDPDIDGRLRWCDGSGSVWDYEISGDADNWRGTRFHLSTRSLADRDSGQWPGNLTGAWDGDSIEVVGTLVGHERTATAEASRGRPAPGLAAPIRFTLRRGTEAEFLAGCRALGGVH